MNDPANANLKKNWERYLKPYNRVDLNTLGTKDKLSAILTEFKKSHLCFDGWGFPDFLSFTKTMNGIVCMIPIDMKGNYDSDFSEANRALVQKLNAALPLGTPPYPANFKFNGSNTLNDGITYTWHHHQAGTHMMLVPTTLNTKNAR